DLDAALAAEYRGVVLRRQILREFRREHLERAILLADQFVRQIGLMFGLAQLFLRALYLRDVGVDGDGLARRGLALVDLDPAAVRAALDVRLARLPVPRQPVGHPRLDPALGVLDEPLFGRRADEVLVGRARRRRSHAGIEQLPIGLVADDQLVGRVVQRESLGNRLDGVGEALLTALECPLRFLGRRHVAPAADHFDARALLVPAHTRR